MAEVMDGNGTDSTPPPVWQVDIEGYLLTPSGVKVGKIEHGQLGLYDKKTGKRVPFTLEDWWTATRVAIARELGEIDN